MMSQGGKTSFLLNISGERMDNDPVKVLWIGPSESNILSVIEPRVDEMLKTCPSLWAKTARGQKYKKKIKLISGAPFRMAWAGSPIELASDDACVVLVDEVDRIDRDIKGEGSVLALAAARRATYKDEGITIAVSTPTEGNVDTFVHEATGVEHWLPSDELSSPIWRLWQSGTRHEWAMPCPHCKSYFVPRMKLLWWPKGSPPEKAKEEAALTCFCCGVQIEQRYREEMIARGLYLAPGQSVVDGEVVGAESTALDATYWISGLASSVGFSWGDLAAQLVSASASGDPNDVKGVVNTGFGECFWHGGEAPKWEEVAAHKREYTSGTVPEEVVYLTAFIDPGMRTLNYNVRGWAWREGHYESWLVESGTIDGDTRDISSSGPWAEAERLLEQSWGERKLQIKLMGIDHGYRKDQVNWFVRKHRRVCRATKGRDHLDKAFYASAIDVKLSNGKVIPRGIRLWHFDSDRMKSWVHSQIQLSEGQESVWHIPGDVSEEYCRQLCAEERMEKPNGSVEWKRTGPNHQLDCEAGAYLMARMRDRSIKLLSGAKLEPPKRTPQVEKTQAQREEELPKTPVQKRFYRRPRRNNMGTW